MLRRSQRNHPKVEKAEVGSIAHPTSIQTQAQHAVPTHQPRSDEQFVDDDTPPVLQPEATPVFEEVVVTDDPDAGYIAEDGTYDGDNYYVENGVLYQKNAQLEGSSSVGRQQQLSQGSGRGVAGDQSTNVCCGLCGAIVPYNQLMEVHLPSQHPEVLSDGIVDLEEIPYDTWLNDRMQQGGDKKPAVGELGIVPGTDGMEVRYAIDVNQAPQALPPHQLNRAVRSTRTLRRISQIRVNIAEMSIPELESALRKKMVEKMGRQVPVTLVDKQHAKCGHCNAVISLNKKFEVVHLIRHFNAWHPSAHKCAGSWLERENAGGGGGMAKPLSSQDFAVIDTNINASDSLQCIWCGMFMDGNALAMHFHEIHPEEIEVPKCNLCLQELVVNARMTEKFGEQLRITMPDEHHYRCTRFNTTQKTEAALDRVIEKRLRGRPTGGGEKSKANAEDEEEEGEGDEEDGATFEEGTGCDVFSNSRMNFGRRSKPKRQFIMPGLRQAVPENSKFVEAVTECHWKCKICNGDIYAAVISAGAIKHYRINHRNLQEEMQYELCKARLDRVGGGCMEFLDPRLDPNHAHVIECLLCHMTFPLHRPFNMCRAIRHLKAKHPEIMPEYQEACKLERGEVAMDAQADGPANSSDLAGDKKRPAAKAKAGATKRGHSSKDGDGSESDPDISHKKSPKKERHPATVVGTPSTEGVGTRTRRAAAAAAAAVIRAATNEERHPEAAVEGDVVYAEEVSDPAVLHMLREQYNVPFERAHAIFGGSVRQRIYVLVNEGEEIDAEMVEQIAHQVGGSADASPSGAPVVVQYSKEGHEPTSPQRASTSSSTAPKAPTNRRGKAMA